MTARLVLPGTASEAGWLAARRSGVTASEIAILMGLSPYSSPYALYWQKRGDLPGGEDKTVFERGHVLEPYIAGKFAGRHPDWYIHGDGRELYAHPDRPWQLATPDRLIHEAHHPEAGRELAVLECKTDAGGDGWGAEGSDDIPVHYRCQVLWQMDVMGVTTAYVACLLIRPWKVRVYELTLDDQARADLALMRVEAELFLCRVADSRPPAVDWRPATSLVLRRLHPSLEDRQVVIPKRMWRAWRAAAGRVTSAEHAKRRMENQIRERLGSASTAVLADGTKVATRSVYDQKSIDTEKLRENYPQAADACTRVSTVSKLTATKIKESGP